MRPQSVPNASPKRPQCVLLKYQSSFLFLYYRFWLWTLPYERLLLQQTQKRLKTIQFGKNWWIYEALCQNYYLSKKSFIRGRVGCLLFFRFNKNIRRFWKIAYTLGRERENPWASNYWCRATRTCHVIILFLVISVFGEPILKVPKKSGLERPNDEIYTHTNPICFFLVSFCHVSSSYLVFFDLKNCLNPFCNFVTFDENCSSFACKVCKKVQRCATLCMTWQSCWR